MILNLERNKTFEYYVKALRGKFNNNINDLVFECNKAVFSLRKTPNDKFKPILLNKLQIGRFYLINYDFNGSCLYCPVMSIDYRVKNNKHIMYVLNLDYLPFEYKIIYFNKLFNIYKALFDDNVDEMDVMNESTLNLNFEGVYNTLAGNGGFNYAISALDVTKIKECFIVSTDYLYMLIHLHMKPVNTALLKAKMAQYDKGSEIREHIEKLINEMEDAKLSFDNDVKDFYKKLRAIENNYKLFEND